MTCEMVKGKVSHCFFFFQYEHGVYNIFTADIEYVSQPGELKIL